MPLEQRAGCRSVDRDLVPVDLGVVGGDVVTCVEDVVDDECRCSKHRKFSDDQQPDLGRALKERRRTGALGADL